MIALIQSDCFAQSPIITLDYIPLLFDDEVQWKRSALRIDQNRFVQDSYLPLQKAIQSVTNIDGKLRTIQLAMYEARKLMRLSPVSTRTPERPISPEERHLL